MIASYYWWMHLEQFSLLHYAYFQTRCSTQAWRNSENLKLCVHAQRLNLLKIVKSFYGVVAWYKNRDAHTVETCRVRTVGVNINYTSKSVVSHFKNMGAAAAHHALLKSCSALDIHL
jgi:hypothetical protein